MVASLNSQFLILGLNWGRHWEPSPAEPCQPASSVNVTVRSFQEKCSSINCHLLFHAQVLPTYFSKSYSKVSKAIFVIIKKPKLDTKIATSTLKFMHHESLCMKVFLLQITRAFPFYHHWTSPKDQTEDDANCSNNFIFLEWLCSLWSSAWGIRLVLSLEQALLLPPPMRSAPHSQWRALVSSHPACPHPWPSSP